MSTKSIIIDIYNLCGLLALLVFFIVYCIQDREFWLHFAGIIICIPSLAFCINRVRLDIKACRRK